MSLLSRLESKLSPYAVPHVTEFLILGQVLALLADLAPGGMDRVSVLQNIVLSPGHVVAGQWWRVITYLFAPPTVHPIFAFFFWYLFYLMGSTLESEWGTFRYNVYLGIGYLASVGMTFLAWFALPVAGQVASNAFLYGSVFLAFAWLYPTFTIYILFILPVQIRWLALLTWIVYAYTLLFSPSWLAKAMVVAAVLNFFLFFGRDILRGARHSHRRMQFQARSTAGRGSSKQGRLVHECRVCGLTSQQAPRTQFRYCSRCAGDCCYCPEHLKNHQHVGEPQPGAEAEEPGAKR